MLRHTLLFLLFSYGLVAYGQDRIPTIRASSSIVDISVGDDLFLKGGWKLEPDKNPDVFSIGSKWPYEYKKVTFITNLDSISFDVQPGNTYNFVILLNDSIPCHTQIVTSPDPVFMNSFILLPTGVAFILLVIVVFWKRNQMNTVLLIRIGYVVALAFWMMTFISGYLHGDYNHLKDVISELGALGTRSEVFTSTSLMVLAFLTMLFSFGFYQASVKLQLSRIPPILTFSKPISLAWAAIFPLGNEFHSITGPLPLLIILASLLGFFLWKRERTFFSLRVVSLISFFIMALILLRFVKPFGMVYGGMIQRFFYLGWTVWIVAVSYWFAKAITTTKVDS